MYVHANTEVMYSPLSLLQNKNHTNVADMQSIQIDIYKLNIVPHSDKHTNIHLLQCIFLFFATPTV